MNDKHILNILTFYSFKRCIFLAYVFANLIFNVECDNNDENDDVIIGRHNRIPSSSYFSNHDQIKKLERLTQTIKVIFICKPV